MSAPQTRPVHPCVLSLSHGTRGAEFSTWARITNGDDGLPNLVTASASTLSIYSLHQGKLLLKHSFPNLAGNVIFLATLESPDQQQEPDALLCGFAGHARLTVLRVTDSLLEAQALLDLDTRNELSVQVDATFCSLDTRPGRTMVGCVLGGGVAVAVTEIQYHKPIHAWCATEPYTIPLASLASHLPTTTASVTTNEASIATGFGDIIDSTFLSGYLEPVLVLLHSEPGGRVWSGRWGRQSSNRGATPLYVTALSVSVTHHRTAVLWSRAVTADALKLYSFGSTGCLVVGASTLIILEAGQIQQMIAVNGWAHAACPSNLDLQANPVVKLAIQLDGCAVTFLSQHSAMLSLRTGQLYVLQRTTDVWILLPIGQTLGNIGEVAHSNSLSLQEDTAWLGKMLQQKTSVMNMGIMFAGSRLGDSFLLGYALETVKLPGDAVKKEEEAVKEEEADKAVKQEFSSTASGDNEYERILRLEEDALYAPASSSNAEPDVVPPSDEEDTDVVTSPSKRPRVANFTVVRSLIPLDSLVNLGPLGPPCEGPLSATPPFLSERETSVAKLGTTSNVFGASAHVFPAGYGSSGGIALLTAPGRDDRMILAEEDCLNVQCIFSLPQTGVVLLGMVPKAGGGVKILRLKRTTGDVGRQTDDNEMEEVDLDVFCRSSGSADRSFFASPREVFQSTILSAAEFRGGQFALLVAAASNELTKYVVVIFRRKDEMLDLQKQLELPAEPGDRITAATPFLEHIESDRAVMSFACTWSSGKACVLSFGLDGLISFYEFAGDTAMDLDQDSMDEEEELKKFYRSSKVVAVDVFRAPENLWKHLSTAAEAEEKDDVDLAEREQKSETQHEEPQHDDEMVDEGDIEFDEVIDWSKLKVTQLKEELKRRELPIKGKKADLVAALEDSDAQRAEAKRAAREEAARKASQAKIAEQKDATDKVKLEGSTTGVPMKASFEFDEVDEELYGVPGDSAPQSASERLSSMDGTEMSGEQKVFLAICRQSGQIEIYGLPQKDEEPTLHWASSGCGLSATLMEDSSDNESTNCVPRSHQIHVQELRFFFCGPSLAKSGETALSPRRMCLAVETNKGDFSLYTVERRYKDSLPYLQKAPLRTVGRPSQEQSRHRTKLMRKGAIAKDDGLEHGSFSYSKLHRFTSISNQDGLFAALPRPQWIVAERGCPAVLFHRTRHAAPAGGKMRPVTGFCSGFMDTKSDLGGFVTLHERVGRVGSQRLTVFHGLADVFGSRGLLPGGGFCAEKIPLGVTVRRIQFIDDFTISTGDHPLYAVLVSRELEADQRDLNDDGLTPEQRKQIKDEKEAERIKKQVEADLGGFEMESEWVEEIEREDCFKIDMSLGGAPPVKKEIYSLWIVDAANEWMVVDSFELDEYEHGLTLEVMSLTEFQEEPGSTEASNIVDEDVTNRLFIVVGTGLLDHNGEDVSSKGRALLFEVKRPEASSRLASLQVVELSLSYEKEILHGPVTTLTCLPSEGRNRLIIGAGADVNVEQWGNGKLTQVGFFRATMQILDIMMFKNFLLLSDAYDSLYFLIWRESDKSLTLLAKDYDPIAVYSAGIMSRGASMSFICQDDRCNLQFFQYAPGEAAARGGNKLVCRADYHLGSQTISFSSHYCRSSLMVHSATPTSTLAALKQQDTYFGRTDDDQRLGVYFGTTDGCFGTVVPLSEPVYWRLTALQSVLANALESDCALSPRAWRLYRRSPRRGGCRSNDRKKGVIDGDLVLRYADLPVADQEDLASSIGSTVDLILDNLLELECASMLL